MTNNEELVRQLYRDFNAREINAVLASLSPDVAWANGMDGGHFRGCDAVRAYWTQQWAAIDPHVNPTQVTEADDGSVTVEVHQVVHDLDGKLLLDEHVRHVFLVQTGQVVRFDIENAGGLSSISHGSQ